MYNIYVAICQGITPSHTNKSREAREHYIISMYFNIYLFIILYTYIIFSSRFSRTLKFTLSYRVTYL